MLWNSLAVEVRQLTSLYVRKIKRPRLHCTHGCSTQSAAYFFVSFTYRITWYTVLMGAPPKVSLCLFAVTTESLGYTVLMGAPPKVQPISGICKLYQQNKWVTMYSRGLKLAFGSRSLQRKHSYSPFRQKSSFVFLKILHHIGLRKTLEVSP